jgi:hypothetical protein
MVRVLRPQADNRSIVVIKPLAAFVPMRQLQAFLAPDSLDLLVIDGPAFGSQELADLAVAVAAILFGKTDQGQPQVILALRDRLIAQGAAGDSEDLAGPPLGCPELLARLDDGGSQVLCRQALGFKKSRLSLRISLSSSRSATIFFSRWFSFSRAFSSFSCDRPMLPNFLRHV